MRNAVLVAQFGTHTCNLKGTYSIVLINYETRKLDILILAC